ncbi:MAG TPA: DUF1425 domain-containing protein [Tepidisphaeraceae bacterium]|jgi:hypothetical protein|nr:DUF1425 domain-containing protein [Tepidisphaeraceae bacterium]
MKAGLLIAALMTSSIGLSGCVKAPIEGRQDPYQSNQVNFAQEDLRRMTAVMAPVLARDESNLLHVSVPIRAATDKQLYVDYRVTFLDRNGQETFRTGWMPKTLSPNVFDQISANSLSPRAADFRMDLRWAQ